MKVVNNTLSPEKDTSMSVTIIRGANAAVGLRCSIRMGRLNNATPVEHLLGETK